MTVYVPGVEELKVAVDVPDESDVGLKETVSPVAGEMTSVRLTDPVKPVDGATVTVELPVAPDTKLTGLVADMPKSGGGLVEVTVT